MPKKKPVKPTKPNVKEETAEERIFKSFTRQHTREEIMDPSSTLVPSTVSYDYRYQPPKLRPKEESDRLLALLEHARKNGLPFPPELM